MTNKLIKDNVQLDYTNLTRGGTGYPPILFELNLQLHAQVDNPYTFNPKQNYSSYSTLKESYNYDGVYGPIPDENGFVNLDYYARDYIADYANVTSIPEENQKYLDSGILPISMSNSFSGLTMCTEINLSKLDTSHCKKMNYLFYKADSKDVEVPSMNIIGIENWNTTSLENIDNLLSGTKSINEIDLSKWDVSNVNSLIDCFNMTEDIPSLNLSNWNLAKFTTFNNLFGGKDNSDGESQHFISFCNKVNMSNWNISHITDLTRMFYYCNTLHEINLSNWDVSSITSVYEMFKADTDGFGNSELNKIIGLETWDVSNMTSLKYFLSGLMWLNDFDISTWDTKNISNFHNAFGSVAQIDYGIDQHFIKSPIFDMTSCKNCESMFGINSIYPSEKNPIHLKNVPKNLDISNIKSGVEISGKIIIDNYID